MDGVQEGDGLDGRIWRVKPLIGTAMNHSFDVSVACELGIFPAVVFNSIGFWVRENAIRGTNYHDGRHWVFNSVAQWSEFFPYATRKQVENALASLRQSGYVETGDYNEDRRVRTLWYTLTPKGHSVFGTEIPSGLGGCISSQEEMHFPSGGNDSINDGSITDINPINKTVTSGQIPEQRGIEKPRKQSKPKKKKAQEFVPPTPEEVEAHARSKGYEIDGKYFCEWYEAAGWRTKSGTKMTNWKQAVIGWCHRNNSYKGGRGQNGHGPRGGSAADFGKWDRTAEAHVL